MPPNSSRPLFELSLRIKSPSEIPAFLLEDMLLKAGVPLPGIIRSREDSHQSISTYLNSLSRARMLKKRLQILSLANVSISVRPFYRTQWQDKWKRNFHPFALTKSIDIVPLWHKKNYRPTKRRPIYIDTVSAFGTGLHETTRFMARLIESCRGKFEDFLDIGTGTGILSMAALSSGAKEVSAIDCDRSCIAVAQANMKANGRTFHRLKAIDLKKFKPQRQFDFVAANLITHDLIRMKRKIVSLVKPKKYLAVSGISLENYPKLLSAFKTLPLHCRQVMKGRQWAAILYQKKK